VKSKEIRFIKKKKTNYIDVGDASNENSVFPITINFENIKIKDMAIMFSEITGRNILLETRLMVLFQLSLLMSHGIRLLTLFYK